MSLPEGFSGAPGPGEPDVFAEPWQAQVFAMVVALHERGVFDWPEWAGTLAREVGRPDAAADGSDYWRHWLRALETLLAAKGVAAEGRVDELQAAWQRAAIATPHGLPVLLENDPRRQPAGSRVSLA